MKNSMNFSGKHLCIGLCFILCFLIVFVLLDGLLFDETWETTVWKKVQCEDGPEILFMGNSHAYVSFIPSVLDSALGMDTEVLASPAQNMYMTLENLKTILRYYSPRLIILEANAIYADNRDEMQGEKKGNTLQNIDGVRSYIDKIRISAKTLKFEDIPLGVTQLCRKGLMYSRWERLGESVAANPFERQDIEGYKILSTHFGGEADICDIENFYTETEGGLFTESRIPETKNEKALHEFLQLAEKNSIEVWIVKAPTLRKDKNMIATMMRIEEIADEYSAVTCIMDLHESMTSMELTPMDFYDRGHLNRCGAVKCTTYFGEILGERLGVTPDYSKAFFYKGENIKLEDDGLYSYTMETFGDTRYCFEQKTDGKYVCISDWSNKNTVKVELLPENADQLRVTMLPADVPISEAATQGLTLSFMVPNASE